MFGGGGMSAERVPSTLAAPSLVLNKVMRRLSMLPAIPDEVAIRLMYRSAFHKAVDLTNPVTFNEKLQWLKLHDRNPLYTELVDKLAVKDWVADRIGSDRVVPTLGVWERFEDIDLEKLPKRFVLKCTHDSGSAVICRDSRSFDKDAARAKLSRALRRDYSNIGREWPYRNVPRRIICEPYIEGLASGDLPDYKFFCFDGEPKIMFVATGRQTMPEPYFDFFDMNFRRLDIKNGHPNSPVERFEKPAEFELMKMFAATLSSGIPFVRVDFYDAGGKAMLGEMTFYHHCGLVPFEPACWDERLGSWLKLPEARS